MKRTLVTFSNGARVLADVVETETEAMRGLKGRARLADGEGMLFDRYGYDTFPQMWMEGMLIPIDMIFANVAGVVVTVVRDARPSLYDRYTSSDPARYVLEVPAYWTDHHGIRRGSTLSFVGPTR